MINGKQHYLRSACWGGTPSLLYGRNSNDKYVERLNMVREANINNLRIFGWHPPEVPLFYRLSDQLGITVWTNFTFASQAFCADPEFLDPAIRECVYIIKKRRNHPSNIFWMGGEEVFFSDAHVASDNKHIMELLGEAVRQVRTTPFGLALLLRGHFGQSWVQTERVRAGQRALLWGRAGVHRGVLHQESLENRDKYGKGYYRYFPILWDLA